MAWKKRSTGRSIDVDVDLEDFEETQLLQALIDAKYISEEEAEAIVARAERKGSFFMSGSSEIDELERARFYARTGRKQEALHHIENYLGREWIGVLQ